MRKAYYIVSPGWTHISSGPRALHHLCHELNQRGEDAYIYPENPSGFALNPNQNTKLISPQYANYYRDNFIAVYPELIRGNPLGAKNVVRWLLAPAGLYGGEKIFPTTDSVWCYRKDIADLYGTSNVLCVPTFQWETFYPPLEGGNRTGTCFYSHKYDRIHNNHLLPITENSIRLEGEPEHIANILRTSEKMYLYEPSEIKVHAAMCGCPVEEIITPYFQGMGEQPDFFDNGKVISKENMNKKLDKEITQFIEITQSC